jgi:uncharacterized membrane protein YeiH
VSQSVDLESAVRLVQQIGDYSGTFAFAVSGAALGVRANYDIVGIAVLACATAVGGGIIRDLMIGNVPPVALVDLRYLAIALTAAALVFLWRPRTRLATRALDVADAAGLAMFCVTGTVTAHAHGLGAPSAVLLGVITAIGGGIIRDVLAGERPHVLRTDSELYAVPALFGATITAVTLETGLYTAVVSIGAAAATFTMRILALRYGWHAPRPRHPSGRETPPAPGKDRP